MKRLLLSAFIALSLLNCETKKLPELSVEKVDKIVFGHKDVIHSDILKEDRAIWIHLPESAMDESTNLSKYPVLYLLDGPGHFYSVTGMIKQLSTTNGNTVSPEMIVVGIPNTDRTRDLTPTHINEIDGDSIFVKTSGGGKNFLNFIEKELMPYVEKTYPVADYKTLVGHSLGGLIVIDALIDRPYLFNNYVAIDPSLWWDDQEVLKRADSILSKNKFDDKALYLAVAGKKFSKMSMNEIINDTTSKTIHTRSILQLAKAAESLKDNGLLFKWKYYENEDHGTLPLIAEYDAIRFLFPWYTFKEIDQLFDLKATTSVADLLSSIDTHYKNVSNHFGYETLPAETFINSLGYGFMGNNQPDKAIAMFKLNIQNYPNSTNVFDSLGDYYLAQQDSIKALEFFTKALEVGDNDFSQEKIDMLNENLEI